MTLETVAMETPAFFATSIMDTLLLLSIHPSHSYTFGVQFTLTLYYNADSGHVKHHAGYPRPVASRSIGACSVNL